MKILIRLDDYSPNRNVAKWDKVEQLLDEMHVKPLVAVIPNDRHFGSRPATEEYWRSVRAMQEKGWTIGLHGESHVLSPIPSRAPREIFFATKAEFIGLPLEAQMDKLRAAWELFQAHGIEPVAFVAPNHGFDASTVNALAIHGRLRFISDGISLRPYRDRSLIWVPQVDWSVPRFGWGLRTICLHPSTMNERGIEDLRMSLVRQLHSVIDFKSVLSMPAADKGTLEFLCRSGFKSFYRAREAASLLLRRTRHRSAT